MFDDKSVYSSIVCFDVSFFIFYLPEYEMYTPRADLRNGTLRPQYYYYYFYYYYC